jgi:multicomponent Na+:H+ antiporter subunit E
VKVRRWIVAGLLFATIWLFVSGPAPTPTSVVTTYLVGLVVGLPLAYIFRRLYEEEISIGRSVLTIPYIFLYLAVFSTEIIRANLDVAYRVLMPGLPLEPQVILVPLRVETDLGITTIANSITITPGTITLDHDPEENALYVHAIDGRNPDDLVAPIRQWENYALVIFDEERTPEDPAPEIRVHPPDHPPEPKTVTESERWKTDDNQEETDG